MLFKKNIDLSFEEIEELLNLNIQEQPSFFISKNITNVVEALILEELKDNYDLNMFEIQKSNLSKVDFRKNKIKIKSIANKIKIDFNKEKIDNSVSFTLIHSFGDIITMEFELTKEAFDKAIFVIQKEALDKVKNLTKNNELEVKSIEIILREVDLVEAIDIYRDIRDILIVEPYINSDTTIMIVEKSHLFTDSINDFTEVLIEEKTTSKLENKTSEKEILPFSSNPSTLATFFREKTNEMKG